MLPKLVVVVMYYEIANTITSDLTFRVYFPDGVGGESTMDASIKRANLPKNERKGLDDGSEPILQFRVPFLMAPFLVVSEGWIKVRCHYEDGSLLRLGRLRLTWRKPAARPRDEMAERGTQG
jgi:hypothetical protein